MKHFYIYDISLKKTNTFTSFLNGRKWNKKQKKN